MSITNVLDPLTLRSAPLPRTSIDTATAVLAPLLNIDAESHEGELLRAWLIDNDSLLGGQPAADARPPSRSAAVAQMPAPRGQSVEAVLAAQRVQQWRVALAGRATVRPGGGARE